MTRTGRPKLSEGEKRSGRIEIRVSVGEQMVMEAAAAKDDVPLSEWIRNVALKAASRVGHQ